MWPRFVHIGLSSSSSELSEMSGKLSSMLPFRIKVATCSQLYLSAHTTLPISPSCIAMVTPQKLALMQMKVQPSPLWDQHT